MQSSFLPGQNPAPRLPLHLPNAAPIRLSGFARPFTTSRGGSGMMNVRFLMKREMVRRQKPFPPLMLRIRRVVI